MKLWMCGSCRHQVRVIFARVAREYLHWVNTVLCACLACSWRLSISDLLQPLNVKLRANLNTSVPVCRMWLSRHCGQAHTAWSRCQCTGYHRMHALAEQRSWYLLCFGSCSARKSRSVSTAPYDILPDMYLTVRHQPAVLAMNFSSYLIGSMALFRQLVFKS